MAGYGSGWLNTRPRKRQKRSNGSGLRLNWNPGSNAPLPADTDAFVHCEAIKGTLFTLRCTL